jgi:hypothetical protein
VFASRHSNCAGNIRWRKRPELDVGPRAKYRSAEGIPRGAVTVRSRGGKAFVEFYVATDTDWSKST